MNIIHFIYQKMQCRSITFSNVVLVGFNLELHSTCNIKDRQTLSDEEKDKEPLLVGITNPSPSFLAH